MSDRSFGPNAVSLRELLPEAEFLGADDIRVNSSCCDSRHCRPGDLFAAFAGSNYDGHEYLWEARERGATAILAERPFPGLGLPTCLVPDSRSAFSRLCQALAGDPSQCLKMVGITGTNGKTTTSYLTAGVLLAGGYTSGILGTLGYFDGLNAQPASWTTPPPAVLAEWLARTAANGCTHAILEVTSHALSQSRIDGVTLDVACITNIRHDHLDFHGAWIDYRAAKARILSHLSFDGVAVINADDRGSVSLLPSTDGPTLTVGIDSPTEISATPIDHCASEQTFLLSLGNETVPVRTSLIGRHNIYNCLIAAAVGATYGIGLEAIVSGLEAVDKIPGRLERIECGQPFSVFVDFAHTPDALCDVLQTLRSVTTGRLICVFGAGGDRDKLKRPLMGHTVEELADLAIVTSDNPRHEDPRAIIGDVLCGFVDRSHVRAMVDRADAIAWALAEARPGDCVVIAGKGHEAHQIIGDDWLPFDDREFARQWLYETPQVNALPRQKAA